jgi:RNA polymerase sigma-54 factor
MALTPRLDLRQSQSLVMTPQLQQAIKLLQLSNIELSAFVESELEQNPLLERDDSPPAPITEESPPPADAADLPVMEARPEEPMVDGVPGQAEEAPLDLDYENTFTNNGTMDESGDLSGGDYGNRGGRLDFSDDGDFEQSLTREESLRDHLMSQLNLEIRDSGDRLIGIYLIEMLDEAGYLSGDLEVLAQSLGCELSRVEAVLARLQRFDPVGLFARSLSECLALQLRERDRLDPCMQALLDNLELLARRDLAQLMRICGADAEDLAQMVSEIRALDPKPALAFDHHVAPPVTPDVLMRASVGGGWLVELNNDTLPRVLVNTRYYAKISGASRSKEDKTYLTERFQSANWLVKSLHQRATTILKVATEIVRQQDAFFHRGIQHLKPLVLKDIALEISMHESTVSRVTANKFIATPRGIFELKYFFTQALGGSDGGESHSAEAVRHRIKTLIDQEPATDILSDDKIVEILKAEGVDIARRTVAKYREALHIPSSVQRRRDKMMQV